MTSNTVLNLLHSRSTCNNAI